MDGLFLACLMGICGMPMSPSVEPLMPLALAAPSATESSATSKPAPPLAPSVADLAATVSIAPPAPVSEQPVERPVPVPSDNDHAAADGVTTASARKTSRVAIGDVVRRHTAAIRRCYEVGLADDPTFTGTIEAAWRIQVDGRVQSVTIVGGTQRNQVVEGCLLAEIPRWEFPATAEPTVVGTYPFTFDPGLLARHTPPAAPSAKAAKPPSAVAVPAPR